jgi:hypothetical protein
MLYQRPIHGCIGIISVDNDCYVGFIAEATRVSWMEIEQPNDGTWCDNLYALEFDGKL